MTDVNSNHMAGLLDFMYSGQVNVKYEDLPKFLKVAEIMQIKGLHTEVHFLTILYIIKYLLLLIFFFSISIFRAPQNLMKVNTIEIQ